MDVRRCDEIRLGRGSCARVVLKENVDTIAAGHVSTVYAERAKPVSEEVGVARETLSLAVAGGRNSDKHHRTDHSGKRHCLYVMLVTSASRGFHHHDPL